MAKIEWGSSVNLVRIGLVLVLVAILSLTGTSLDHLVFPFLGMSLIILLIETVKLNQISDANGAWAEIVLSVTIAVLGGRFLLASFGRTFTEYHVFLILLLVGGLIILYGAYKKLSASA